MTINKRGGVGLILVLIILAIIIGGIFYVFSNSETRKEVCGTHTETYTQAVRGCDKISNCQCIHESWGGLGACDSCQCTKEVSNC